MSKGIRLLILLLLVIIVTAGCRTSQQQESITVSINYPSVQQFYKMYGHAFEMKFPHIKIQVIPDDAVDEGNIPTDIVYMNGIQQYEEAIELDILRSLTMQSNEQELHIEGVSPVVSTLLAAASPDGQLYAVAPTFHSEALYYNKALFDRYDVTYPYNGMSWQDVFALSMQFPNETIDGERLYGMQMNYYRDITLNYIIKAGEAEQLSYIDPDTMNVTMNSEKWKEIWSYAIQAFRAGVIYDKVEELDSMQHPAFLTEDAAMTVGSHNVAYNFEPFSKFEGGTMIDWGMATIPIDPGNPEYSNSYAIYDFFGISSSSEHYAEALELLTFILGDPINSRLIAQKQPNYGMPAVLDYINPIGEYDLSPLYTLKVNPRSMNLYHMIEPEVIDSFKSVAQAILDEAIQGEITIDEALDRVELEGQMAIDEAMLRLEEKESFK